MPVISDRNKLFIHIAKNMGSSIEKYFHIADEFQLFSLKPIGFTQLKFDFRGFSRDEVDSINYVTPQHLTAYQLKRLVPSIWNKYTSFAIVRNPYERMVSEYNYIQKHDVTKCKDFKNLSFREFILKTFALPPFVRHVIFDSHFSTQKSFVVDSTGEIIVNDILRFEDIESIKNYLGIVDIPHELFYTKNSHMDYYDDELKELVYNFFKEDFDLFNYIK